MQHHGRHSAGRHRWAPGRRRRHRRGHRSCLRCRHRLLRPLCAGLRRRAAMCSRQRRRACLRRRGSQRSRPSLPRWSGVRLRCGPGVRPIHRSRCVLSRALRWRSNLSRRAGHVHRNRTLRCPACSRLYSSNRLLLFAVDLDSQASNRCTAPYPMLPAARAQPGAVPTGMRCVDALSSNGRTAGFDPVYPGSNPGGAIADPPHQKLARSREKRSPAR